METISNFKIGDLVKCQMRDCRIRIGQILSINPRSSNPIVVGFHNMKSNDDIFLRYAKNTSQKLQFNDYMVYKANEVVLYS